MKFKYTRNLMLDFYRFSFSFKNSYCFAPGTQSLIGHSNFLQVNFDARVLLNF